MTVFLSDGSLVAKGKYKLTFVKDDDASSATSTCIKLGYAIKDNKLLLTILQPTVSLVTRTDSFNTTLVTLFPIFMKLSDNSEAYDLIVSRDSSSSLIVLGRVFDSGVSCQHLLGLTKSQSIAIPVPLTPVSTTAIHTPRKKRKLDLLLVGDSQIPPTEYPDVRNALTKFVAVACPGFMQIDQVYNNEREQFETIMRHRSLVKPDRFIAVRTFVDAVEVLERHTGLDFLNEMKFNGSTYFGNLNSLRSHAASR